MTVKLHALLFPIESRSREFTAETPTGNAEPDGGTHTTVAPGQLSLISAEKLTVASHRSGLVFTIMFVGHNTVGRSVSVIVTLNEHVSWLPLRSTAAHITVVRHFANREPEGGRQEI